ncbi:ALP1-like protein isoform X1 [Tanacetum coccineum]
MESWTKKIVLLDVIIVDRTSIVSLASLNDIPASRRRSLLRLALFVAIHVSAKHVRVIVPTVGCLPTKILRRKCRMKQADCGGGSMWDRRQKTYFNPSSTTNTFKIVEFHTEGLWLHVLKHFYEVINGFLETSVDTLTEDQITKLDNQIKECNLFSYDLSWAHHRLDMVKMLKFGKLPEAPFVVNGRTYKQGYYLADGIYPTWSTFVKTFSIARDEKTLKFKRVQESARKDIERAFGVLQVLF